MQYKKQNGKIEINPQGNFDIAETLDCGQIFSYQKTENGFVVFSGDKVAYVKQENGKIVVKTTDVDYFENFFDLKTDYSVIKKQLKKFDFMQTPLKFGGGIRILRQNLLETLISFVISANNNIPRIKNTLFALRKNFGEQKIYTTKLNFEKKNYIENGNTPKNTIFVLGDNVNSITKMQDKCSNVNNLRQNKPNNFIKMQCEEVFYAFPTYEKLQNITQEQWQSLGTGYRATQICKLLKQISPNILQSWQTLDTSTLRKNLMSLCGVGGKVADCVLLFGYHRMDVFPVDTWIAKISGKIIGGNTPCGCSKTLARERIRQKLVEMFGDLSGYAQQYIFNARQMLT